MCQQWLAECIRSHENITKTTMEILSVYHKTSKTDTNSVLCAVTWTALSPCLVSMLDPIEIGEFEGVLRFEILVCVQITKTWKPLEKSRAWTSVKTIGFLQWVQWKALSMYLPGQVLENGPLSGKPAPSFLAPLIFNSPFFCIWMTESSSNRLEAQRLFEGVKIVSVLFTHYISVLKWISKKLLIY